MAGGVVDGEGVAMDVGEDGVGGVVGGAGAAVVGAVGSAVVC